MISSLHDAVVGNPGGTLLGLDFDGTLSPIVDDPMAAHIHPQSLAALQRLGAALGRIAIITGRPVDKALELGNFEGRAGLERLVICGQYGAERWDAATGEIYKPPAPDSVRQLDSMIDDWLEERGASVVRIERKRLAVGLHTRGVPGAVLDNISGPLQELAQSLGLHLEPGRQVIELRAPGSDKGQALRLMVSEVKPSVVVYAGDDLGDLPAFDEVDVLRSEGVDGYLVCSTSAEQNALESRSDLVLHGPSAVAGWLTGLADAVAPG